MIKKRKTIYKGNKLPKDVQKELGKKTGLTTEKLDPAKVLSPVNFQIGKSKTRIDEKYEAMLPGKRESKYGKTYYEYRKNRSDLRNRV